MQSLRDFTTATANEQVEDHLEKFAQLVTFNQSSYSQQRILLYASRPHAAGLEHLEERRHDLVGDNQGIFTLHLSQDTLHGIKDGQKRQMALL